MITDDKCRLVVNINDLRKKNPKRALRFVALFVCDVFLKQRSVADPGISERGRGSLGTLVIVLMPHHKYQIFL